MDLPTKEELKERYNISNDDFRVLMEMPSKEEIKKEGFLMMVADALGMKSWMWKSFSGVVLAIIFLAPAVATIDSFWRPAVVKSYSAMVEYWQSYSTEPSNAPIDFVAFVPDNQESKYPSTPLPLDQYPLGTGVFPVSSAWTGPTGQWLG